MLYIYVVYIYIYILMIKFNFRMDTCFKYQVKECQNASIENWIRAAKFW